MRGWGEERREEERGRKRFLGTRSAAARCEILVVTNVLPSLWSKRVPAPGLPRTRALALVMPLSPRGLVLLSSALFAFSGAPSASTTFGSSLFATVLHPSPPCPPRVQHPLGYSALPTGGYARRCCWAGASLDKYSKKL